MAESEYTGMLMQISELILEDDLLRLKFACRQHIREREREQITSALDLWQSLEQKELLGQNNVLFLKSLITSCKVDARALRLLEAYQSNEYNAMASNVTPSKVAHQLANEFLAQLSSQIVNDITRTTEALTLAEETILSNERLTFHERCGSLVKLSNGRRTGERRRPLDEFNNGVVMTNRPLKDDELFEIRLDRLVDKWSGSIEVGITTHNPSAIDFPATMTNMRSGTIMMSGCGILTNGKGTSREYGQYNLDALAEGDRIGLIRKSDGSLHYFINGVDQGMASNSCPATVWGVVDLYGMAVKVTILDRNDPNYHHMVNSRGSERQRAPRQFTDLYDEETSAEEEVKRLTFHTRCGTHAAVVNNGRTAHRRKYGALDDFNNGVVLTNRFVHPNEVFEVRIDKMVDKWAGSIEIGLTLHTPESLEFPSTMTNIRSGTWMMTGNGVMYNGTTLMDDYGQNLDRLKAGDRVGVVRKETGTVHFFVNGIDQGAAASNVPENVYGVIDLYGQAAEATIVDQLDSLSSPDMEYSSLTDTDMLMFHHIHGSNSAITNGGRTAIRPSATGEFNDAIVMSNRPLRDNELFEVIIEKMVDRWSGSIEAAGFRLTAGVTLIKPEGLEFPNTMTDIEYDTWMLSGSAIMQDGSTIRNGYPLDLDSVSVGCRIGMMRCSDGTLHFFLNGTDQGVACSDIPPGVWAVIDLYGQCGQVSITSGSGIMPPYNNVINRAIVAENPNYVSPVNHTGLDRIPSDKELYSIAGNIGHGWQMLAVYLGIDHTQVDQIEQDYRSTVDRIFRLLVRWKQLRADGATLRELFYQMHHTGHGLNWSRDGIATSLNLMESDIRDCKNARTQRDYTDYGGKPSVPKNPENKLGKSKVGVVHARPEESVSSLRSGLSLIDRWNQRSNRPPKETCIYDGRLILLSDEDREQIKMACTSQNKIGKGGFGIVYKQTNEGLGITVAIKKITADSREMKNSARREMFASRILHPFILPLLATFEESIGSHSEIYFISPYCENGDLYEILKECRDSKNPDSCRVWLSQTQRIRIILQVAIAIQYLHTPVKDVRGIVIHKDISSSNIVLDINYNARLIDFGLAREIDDVTSRASGRIHYLHPDVGKPGSVASVVWDIYSYGVVILELLTGLDPSGKDGTHLRYMPDINQNLASVWLAYDDDSQERAQLLGSVAQSCLTAIEGKFSIKDDVIDKVQKQFRQRIMQTPEEDKKKCESCMINPDLSEATESNLVKHRPNCNDRIRLCIACERNSSLNPVSCYSCGAKMEPMIGVGWGALLVAGNDTDNVNNARAFKGDMEKFKRIITSRAPLVMGIRQEHVKSVAMENPGRCENGEKLLPQIDNAIQELEKTKLHTLVVYFSCHGDKNGENSFQLASKAEKLSISDFQDMLSSLTTVRKVIIILDRCFADKITVKNKTIVQINASKSSESAPVQSVGSPFTKYLIQGLKARSEGETCDIDQCCHCNNYWATRNDYITLGSLMEYIRGHMNAKGHHEPYCHFEGDVNSLKLAYYPEEVFIDFAEDRKTVKQVPMAFCEDMDELESQLLKMFQSSKVQGTTALASTDRTLAEKKNMKSYRAPKDVCMYDGRLLKLGKTDRKKLQSECKEENEIGSGGFGKVYASKTSLPGFDMRVAIKRVCAKGQHMEKAVKREMNASRILHPFILPLLAVFDEGHKRHTDYYIISPFCENNSLRMVIDKNPDKLSQFQRIRIGLQLALAIEYLHAPVKNVRKAILHKDITSKNVVLDVNLNARLIDFGLAREEDDCTSTGAGTEGYRHPKQGDGLCNMALVDYFQFGVVLRELLTDIKPTGITEQLTGIVAPEKFRNKHLCNIESDYMLKYLDYKKLKWWPMDDDNTNANAKVVNDVASQCLKATNVEWPKVISQLKLIDHISNKELNTQCTLENPTLLPIALTIHIAITKELVKKRNLVQGEVKNLKLVEKQCEVCMINSKGKSIQLYHPNCRRKMAVCVACEKNSFFNPITCFTCGKSIQPIIGKEWGALLVAGDGIQSFGQNSKDIEERVFKDDVEEIKRVITSRAPLIMGIIPENVEEVLQDNKQILPRLEEAFQRLQNREVTKMFMYVSCHGSSKNDNEFIFGSETLSLVEFQRQLDMLSNIKTFVIILDRCFPPKIELKNAENVLQFNASKSSQASLYQKSSGSLFTRFFIQALKGQSENVKCLLKTGSDNEECCLCSEFRSDEKDYLSVKGVFSYVEGHMENEKATPVKYMKGDLGYLGYYTDEEIRIEFTHELDDGQKIPMQLEPKFFRTIEEVKTELLNQCKGETANANSIVKIEMDTCRQDNPREECSSIEMVMSAWAYRKPLYVKFDTTQL